jgi:hypothetical protein
VTDPIVDPTDLAALLGQPVDEDRASALIVLAQELCSTVVDPVPANARSVVLGVALRAYVNPQNVQSQQAAVYGVNYGPAASGGLYLTRQDRATLKRVAGRGGAFTFDPTPDDAGQGLSPWDTNTTWLSGVPLADNQNAAGSP